MAKAVKKKIPQKSATFKAFVLSKWIVDYPMRDFRLELAGQGQFDYEFMRAVEPGSTIEITIKKIPQPRLKKVAK